MKYSLGIPNFLEEISSLSHSIVFLYFFASIAEEVFLISPCYSSEFCIQMGISLLFSFAFTSLIFTCTSPDGQHWNQIDYILCSQRWRNSIQSAQTRLGADCGSDHECLIVKFRLKLKKVGETTRPFRYDLDQILYDYTVEVRNRFKGLDLIECLMSYGWRFMTLYKRQSSRPSPRNRNAKRQNGCLRRPSKYW